MKFQDMKITEYQDILASKKSTPGGGSALALVLLNAISLCEMVYNFTVDKKGFEDIRDELIEINKKLQLYKEDAYFLLNEDSVVFNALMDAYKSKDEKRIEDASIDACEVPYRLYQVTKNVQVIAKSLSLKGNPNVISDSKIADDLCSSIYNGCQLNIKANLKCVHDKVLLEKYLSVLD